LIKKSKSKFCKIICITVITVTARLAVKKKIEKWRKKM